MSKININIKSVSKKRISAKDIPSCTYFTGVLINGTYSEYFKTDSSIICLKSGAIWNGEGSIINDYQECDVEITMTPIK